MGKKITQKNNEKLVATQASELAKLRESLPLDTIRAAEDKLLAQCLRICEGSLDFSSLGFTTSGEVDEDNLPLEWQMLPDDQKAQKIRLAKYSCLPSADVPYGVKAAFATMTAIIKARATENSGHKTFNMEVSVMPAPTSFTDEAIDAEYEVIDVE